MRAGGPDHPELVSLLVGLRAIHRGRGESQPDSGGSDPAAARHPNRSESINVANIKSQIKRILTNKKAQDRNKAVKSEVKTAVRATREAIAAGDKDTAAAALALAAKKLDKAASKGVIHKNQAANRKSAIAKQVAAL